MKDPIRETMKEVEEATGEMGLLGLTESGSVKITFRTKPETKQKAEEVFARMGLTMSGAINVFLAQCVREQRLPFQPGATSEEIEEGEFEEMIDEADRILAGEGRRHEGKKHKEA